MLYSVLGEFAYNPYANSRTPDIRKDCCFISRRIFFCIKPELGIFLLKCMAAL